MSAHDCFIININQISSISDCIFFLFRKITCGYYYSYYNNKFDNNWKIMIIIML